MARKTRRWTRRGIDPTKLPYAEEAEVASEIVDFLFNRLPEFIGQELRNIDIAVSEANLFRELSNLSDATLKRMGLKRSDLPALVASTYHLLNLAKTRGRGRPAARRGRASTAKRKAVKRKAVKRKAVKRKAAKRKTARRTRA